MLLPGTNRVVCDNQACDARIEVQNVMYQHQGGLQYAADMAGWLTAGKPIQHFCPSCRAHVMLPTEIELHYLDERGNARWQNYGDREDDAENMAALLRKRGFRDVNIQRISLTQSPPAAPPCRPS